MAHSMGVGGQNWVEFGPRSCWMTPYHSDLNDQNSFHSTIDAPLGVPAVSKNWDDQTELNSCELDCQDSAKIEETEKPSKLNKNSQRTSAFWRFFNFYSIWAEY